MINYILSSILLGKSLAKLISDVLINIIPYTKIILTDISTVSDGLSRGKVYDLLEWGLFFLLTTLTFIAIQLIIKFFIKNEKARSENFFNSAFLIFSIATFLITNFSVHSPTLIIAAIAIFNLLYWGVYKYLYSNNDKIEISLRSIYNGFLTGLLIVLSLGRASTLNIFVLIFSCVVYHLFSQRFKRYTESSFHLLFGLSIFFYSSRISLLIILVTGIILITLKKSIQNKRLNIKTIYFISAIIIVCFNPLFYTGKFDTVEEGFWLGWLQRLINHEFIYKDFYAYHPPLLLWGLNFFGGLTSYSVYTSRLFFHTLQVLGLVILSLISYKLIKNKFLLFSLLLIIFSLSGIEVRNNVEIRLALGVLSLYLLRICLDKKRLLFSGILTFTSLFTSIEVGIPALVAAPFYIILKSRQKLKSLFYFFAGFLLVAIPGVTFLLANSAFSPFMLQLSEYSSLFSRGYFNVIIERPVELSFFYWHIFYEYLGQTSFYWFFAQLTFGFTWLWYLYRKIIIKKTSGNLDFVLALSFFGLLVSRSSLGRSDYYHLLYLLFLSLIIFFYLIGSVINKYYKSSYLVIVPVFTLLIFGNQLKYFLSGLLYKYQTYGQTIGKYQSYESERYKIMVEDDPQFVTEKNDLIKYIIDNTSSNDKIFAFPWMPEIYFLTNKRNATSFDNPYAFVYHQDEILDQLKIDMPKIVIYNPNFNIGNFNVSSLDKINGFINSEYSEVKWFGSNIVMQRK